MPSNVTWVPCEAPLGLYLNPWRIDGALNGVEHIAYRHTVMHKAIEIYGCSTLRSISAPDLTDIVPSEASFTVSGGDDRFFGTVSIEICASLQSVSLPNVTRCGNFVIGSCPVLTTINLPSLQVIQRNSPPDLWTVNFVVTYCNALTSISLPSFVSFQARYGNITITNNPSLTSISLPLFVPGPTAYLSFNQNALNQTTVDHILAICAASTAFASGSILRLEGGTNATPSAAGLANKAILQSRGVTVFNN